MKFLLALLLSCCTVAAIAQAAPPPRTVKITLAPPTTYEDGSTIPVGKTITYNTYVGACNATLTRVGTNVGVSSTAPNVTPGQCVAAEAVVDGATSPSIQVIYHGRPGAVTILIVSE